MTHVYRYNTAHNEIIKVINNISQFEHYLTILFIFICSKQHHKLAAGSPVDTLWAPTETNSCIDMDGVAKQLDIQVRNIDHGDHVKSVLLAAGKQRGQTSILHTWYAFM